MTLPANIRVNIGAPFPATVKGSGAIQIQKANGIWTVSINFALYPTVQVVADPANTYVLTYNPLTMVTALVAMKAVASVAKVVKVLTAAGPYAAQPADDVLIVKQAAGAPFTVNVDWSMRTTPLRIVDGKGDASVNNITITPTAGQTQLAALNYSYVISQNGGSIILTPLPDNSGAY